jgi:hypothetical protein
MRGLVGMEKVQTACSRSPPVHDGLNVGEALGAPGRAIPSMVPAACAVVYAT